MARVRFDLAREAIGVALIDPADVRGVWTHDADQKEPACFIERGDGSRCAVKGSLAEVLEKLEPKPHDLSPDVNVERFLCHECGTANRLRL